MRGRDNRRKDVKIKMNGERNLRRWLCHPCILTFLLLLRPSSPYSPHTSMLLSSSSSEYFCTREVWDSSSQPSFLSSSLSPSTTTTPRSSSALPPPPANPRLHYVLCSPLFLLSSSPTLVLLFLPWRTSTSCSDSNKPHWPGHTSHPTQTLLSLLYLSLFISLYVSSQIWKLQTRLFKKGPLCLA